MLSGWCWSIGGSTALGGRLSVRERRSSGVRPRRYGKWVRRAETDQGVRPGLSSDQLAELKELRRENRELRRANEVLG